MSNAGVPLLFKNRWSAGRYHRRQFCSVPVCETDTAVGMRTPDRRRLGCTVDPVVIYRKTNPDHTHGIIRAGMDFRCRIFLIGIPEQLRVVKEPRIAFDARDLPCPD